ncbi:MAG: hypothetical protein HYR94_02845 [Chloroflexi bacterium]|nr:hypothetical protein [Chloroflexota bacterium]
METPAPTDRLEIVNALLIALVTLIGAFVAWRVSVASDNAGDAALAGLIATLNAQYPGRRDRDGFNQSL